MQFRPEFLHSRYRFEDLSKFLVPFDVWGRGATGKVPEASSMHMQALTNRLDFIINIRVPLE